VDTRGDEAEMSDRNVPVTEGAANDRELTRLMAGLLGMVYRASAQSPFVFETVGGGDERMYGRSAEDLVGKPEILMETMHPDDASRYVETVTAAVDRREPFHLEYRLIQPDGTERAVWEKGRPLAMPAGGTISVVPRNVTFVDLVLYPDLAPGDYVRIDLSDTGVGIAETDLRKIFDPFFSTKRRGSGLGLATSYAIVHKHDGYIGVASTPGAGTTFSILLPAAPAGPSRQSRETVPQFNGHGRVLVMDDEPTVRQVAVAMLKKLGYEAETVPDGASALRADAEARAAGRPFSVILMDLTIPGGMGGEEAVVALRAQRTTARLIASSGYATDPVVAQYRSYHFDGVLAKPYSFTELTSVLASLADQPSILGPDV